MIIVACRYGVFQFMVCCPNRAMMSVTSLKSRNSIPKELKNLPHARCRITDSLVQRAVLADLNAVIKKNVINMIVSYNTTLRIVSKTTTLPIVIMPEDLQRRRRWQQQRQGC